MKKSIILSLFIALTMMFTLANFNTVAAQQTVEDQYWEAVKNSTKADDFQNYLKEYPNGKYAAIARQKVNPQTPPTPPPSANKTDAEYLNSWAAEVRVGLPEWVAGFQLKTAWSRCPVGCQEKDSSPYLLLKFDTEGEQQYVGINDLKKDLMPSLLQVYCKTEAPRRKIMLGVFFDNRGQQADYNNFWVEPIDCSTKTVQKKIVFITSQKYDGNLGGVSGANNICQTHAKNAELSGTFKAWIADNYSSPWTTFTRSTVPYVMTDGTQIAADWQSLVSSNLEAKFDVNEYKQKHINGGAWTGTDEGKKLENCKGWTTNDSGEGGTEGCSSTTDSRWGRTNCGENWCHYKYRLYCFQQ